MRIPSPMIMGLWVESLDNSVPTERPNIHKSHDYMGLSESKISKASHVSIVDPFPSIFSIFSHIFHSETGQEPIIFPLHTVLPVECGHPSRLQGWAPNGCEATFGFMVFPTKNIEQWMSIDSWHRYYHHMNYIIICYPGIQRYHEISKEGKVPGPKRLRYRTLITTLKPTCATL